MGGRKSRKLENFHRMHIGGRESEIQFVSTGALCNFNQTRRDIDIRHTKLQHIARHMFPSWLGESSQFFFFFSLLWHPPPYTHSMQESNMTFNYGKYDVTHSRAGDTVCHESTSSLTIKFFSLARFFFAAFKNFVVLLQYVWQVDID